MQDNMNNYTAILEGCSTKSENIENLGDHTFVSLDGATGRVVIESDDQGGINSFIGNDNSFFIIKYFGKMPKITYQYHFHDTELDTIFEIDPNGDAFGKLVFKPTDDTAVGSIESVLSLAGFDDYSKNLIREDVPSLISSTFAIHSYIGETTKNNSIHDCIGISVYSRGVRTPILKVLGTGLILGSVSKRIILTLSETTKLESFSFGELKMFDATLKNDEGLSKKIFMSEMLEDYAYKDYYQDMIKFKKMLDAPNKIFNTESGI